MAIKGNGLPDFAKLTLSSELSKSFAISSSLGRPPAVTSLARVNVQYVSLLLVGGATMVSFLLRSLGWCNSLLVQDAVWSKISSHL